MTTALMAGSCRRAPVSVVEASKPNFLPRWAAVTPPEEAIDRRRAPVALRAGSRTWPAKFPAPMTPTLTGDTEGTAGPTALAAHLRRLVHRFGAPGRSCYQDRVHATAKRKREAGGHGIDAVPQLHGLRAEQPGERALPVVEVDSEHAAAVRPQKLNRDQ